MHASWPDPLAESAFHGLAGEIVRMIEPCTESDPAALLIQLLVAFGNVIDRGPHWRAEADRHGLNLFAVLVGETSKARKGSSWAHIRNLFSDSDPIWKDHCIQTGLSSGEGLIYAVRDPPEVRDGSGDGGAADNGPKDSGPLDTRLLVMESEFASPLRMITRDGNTLSPIVRQAWDGGTLQVMTRQSPLIATRAHVSMIGHVTRDELRRELIHTDAANGFGNRFLWVCVRRSKVLPDGGRVPDSDFGRLAVRLKQAVDYAYGLGDHELHRNNEARALWHEIYPGLSEGKPGLLGAVTSRGEAQVMRVACVYALLDESPEIRREHLLAALAVWAYCGASARYIFGAALGDPLADILLGKLSACPSGLTRTELSAALGRNRSALEIEQALKCLLDGGLVRMEREETQGRTAERWYFSNPGISRTTTSKGDVSSNSFNS
jgi:Protein of unknown function (DUF3987)